MRNRLMFLATLSLGVVTFSLVVSAQAPARSAPPSQPASSKPADLAGDWAPDGRRGGIGQSLSISDIRGQKRGNEDDIPYQPWALERRKQNAATRDTTDPQTKCFTLGTPRGVYYPEPFQIFQRARDLTLLFEFGHSVRTIHTNGSTHPEGPLDQWLGDARARWEDDTLVVDVTEFNDQTWFDRAGNFHSDALHVVERWRLLDANTIEYRARLDDPKVFTEPWNITVLLHRRREPGVQLIENYCYTHEYDEFYPYPKEATR